MYKPKDWDKVNPKPIGKSVGYAFNRENMYEHGEMCADAMSRAIGEDLLKIISSDAWNKRTLWVFASLLMKE